jgi:hypothetical protein
LYWSTGKPGKDLDLAGLVCNSLPDAKRQLCVNPCLGQEGGDTWEKRRGFMDAMASELMLKSSDNTDAFGHISDGFPPQ